MSRYDDIIALPHHVSDKRPQMSLHDRAAQFLPFAALTGYDDAVRETARVTDDRPELREDALELLDRRLRLLEAELASRPEITITYFLQDEKKQGGAFVSRTGVVRRIDGYERKLLLEDGAAIPIADVLMLEGDVFSEAEDGAFAG